MRVMKGYDLVAIAERLGFSKSEIRRVLRRRAHRGLSFDGLWCSRDAARFLLAMGQRVRQHSHPYAIVYRQAFRGAPQGHALRESTRALLLCFAADHAIRIVTL